MEAFFFFFLESKHVGKHVKAYQKKASAIGELLSLDWQPSAVYLCKHISSDGFIVTGFYSL